MDTFPSDLFPQLEWQLWPVGATVDGGSPIGRGRGQTLDWSGGGFWALSIAGVSLLDPDQIRLWRALMARLRGGATEMIFPIPDRAQMPWLGGRPLPPPLVPHGDGSPFSDGSLYAGRNIVYELVQDLDEGAMSARVKRVAGGAIKGGELLTLVYDDAGPRAHLLDGAWPVDGQPDQYDVTFIMPAWGDLGPGADVDFERPRFVASLVGRDGAEWPKIVHPNTSTVDLVVAESFAYLDPELDLEA